MKSIPAKLTTSQFAKLHKLNKRTLHYYDEIGLFSPMYKGKNNYRYYDLSQSAELEFILMLKELKMSITEIREYLNHPNREDFIRISDKKQSDIDAEIEKLKSAQQILEEKKRQLLLCSEVSDGQIKIDELPRQYVFTTSFGTEDYNMEIVLKHLKQAWDAEQYKSNCGVYISVERIKERQYENYNGLFTPLRKKHRNVNCICRPEGKYLCGYAKGSWEKIPALYENMLGYARAMNIELTGYAYEIGLNEFAISNIEEYVTQVIMETDIKSLY